MIEENGFVEHAQFSGNRYGTSRKALADIQSTGRRAILDIDAQVRNKSHRRPMFRILTSNQGVRLIKRASIEATYLFIAPPTFASLQERLTGRGTETQESISKRLDTAIKEIKFAQTPDVHDVVVVNDSLDRAYDLFKRIALGETLEGDRLPQYDLP
jgi:guanylate kinase